MLGAVVVPLQRQLLARHHHDPLHPEAGAEIDGLVPAPGLVDPRRRVRLRGAVGFELGDQALDLLRALDRRDQERVGRVDDGEALDAEHAEEAAVGAEVAVGDVAGVHPALADDAIGVARALLPDRFPVADVGPGESPPRATAPRRSRSITAWSKLIFGRVEEGRAELQRAELGMAVADRAPDRLERLRRVPLDLAQAGVGAEAEHAGVPEAALGDQPRRRGGVGLLDETRERVAAGGERGAAGDVAVGGRRLGRRDAEDDDPTVGRRGARRRPRRGRRPRRRGSGGRTASPGRSRSGSRRAARQAARVTAASVSRPSGSSASSIAAPASAACSATRNREAAALTTIGAAKSSPARRLERALERRGAAEHRHVLLGEVPSRHRPEPRAGAAAEDRRDQRAGGRASDP